jgi:membrane protein EpsK
VANLAGSFWAMAVRLPVTFLLTPFLLTQLGDERYGAFAVLISLTAYLNLAGGPLHSSIGREYAHAGDDPVRRSRVLTNAITTSSLAAVVTAGIGLPIAGPLMDALRIPASFRDDAIICYYTLVGTVLASQLVTPFLGLLMSKNRYDLIDLLPALGQVAYALLAVLVFRWRGPSLVLLGLAHLVSYVMALLALAGLSLRHLGGARLGRGNINWGELRALLGFSGELLVINVSVLVTYQTDNLVISRMIGVAAVAHYAVAANLITRFRQLCFGLSRTFMPATADPTTTPERRRQLHFRGTRYMTLFTVVLAGVSAGLAEPFSDLWLGEAYRPSAEIYVLLVAANMVAMSQFVTNSVLTALRHTRPLMVSEVIGAIANLVLSIAFVRAGFGLPGVALGTLVPLVLRNGWLAVHGAHVVGAPVRPYVTGIYLPAIWVLLATFLALRALVLSGWIGGWPSLLAAAAGGLLLALVLADRLALDDEERRSVRTTLFHWR